MVVAHWDVVWLVDEMSTEEIHELQSHLMSIVRSLAQIELDAPGTIERVAAAAKEQSARWKDRGRGGQEE